MPLTVFQNRRLDGDFLTARRVVEGGELGTVLRFESRFERFRPDVGEGWRELPAQADGGGLLLDLGAHLVDQARELFGHPLRVYAEIDARRPGAEVEDDVFLALEHPDGVRSHLWMSAVAPLHGPRLRVSGTRAGFASDGLDPQEPQLEQGMRPGDEGYGVSGPGRLVDAAGPASWRSSAAPTSASTRRWCRGCATAPPRPLTLATAWPACACSTPRARAPPADLQSS